MLKYRLEHLERDNTELTKELSFTEEALQEVQKSILYRKEELRQVIAQIRAAGKEVYAHADELSMGHYVLLSGVSRISLVPTGDVWITGLYGEAPYVRLVYSTLQTRPAAWFFGRNTRSRGRLETGAAHVSLLCTSVLFRVFTTTCIRSVCVRVYCCFLCVSGEPLQLRTTAQQSGDRPTLNRH